MIITEKNAGAKIAYTLSATWLTFGGYGLSIDVAALERDDAAHYDICVTKFGTLVMGVIPGLAEEYAAQIDIPPRAYAEQDGGADEDGQPLTERIPLPLDTETVTLTLWAINI